MASAQGSNAGNQGAVYGNDAEQPTPDQQAFGNPVEDADRTGFMKQLSEMSSVSFTQDMLAFEFKENCKQFATGQDIIRQLSDAVEAMGDIDPIDLLAFARQTSEAQ